MSNAESFRITRYDRTIRTLRECIQAGVPRHLRAELERMIHDQEFLKRNKAKLRRVKELELQIKSIEASANLCISQGGVKLHSAAECSSAIHSTADSLRKELATLVSEKSVQ